MSKTVTMDRDALDAFCAQWPCHGFPDALDRIVFEFADNGDLVDINAYAQRNRVIDSADFDSPALLALSHDAQERDGDEPITPVIFRMSEVEKLRVSVARIAEALGFESTALPGSPTSYAYERLVACAQQHERGWNALAGDIVARLTENLTHESKR